MPCFFSSQLVFNGVGEVLTTLNALLFCGLLFILSCSRKTECATCVSLDANQCVLCSPVHEESHQHFRQERNLLFFQHQAQGKEALIRIIKTCTLIKVIINGDNVEHLKMRVIEL